MFIDPTLLLHFIFSFELAYQSVFSRAFNRNHFKVILNATSNKQKKDLKNLKRNAKMYLFYHAFVFTFGLNLVPGNKVVLG